MKISELPVGDAPRHLPDPLFPLLCQNVIWRNWGLVPVERIAAVLKCSEEEYSLKSIDYETCKSIWKNSQFKTIELPSIYTLSDGSTTNMIGIDYK